MTLLYSYDVSLCLSVPQSSYLINRQVICIPSGCSESSFLPPSSRWPPLRSKISVGWAVIPGRSSRKGVRSCQTFQCSRKTRTIKLSSMNSLPTHQDVEAPLSKWVVWMEKCLATHGSFRYAAKTLLFLARWDAKSLVFRWHMCIYLFIVCSQLEDPSCGGFAC